MSAMHWEARRRRSALDRMIAQDKQQVLHMSSETICKTTESNRTEEQSAGSPCPHGTSGLKTTCHDSAKIPNRYSVGISTFQMALQYTQQW